MSVTLTISTELFRQLTDLDAEIDSNLKTWHPKNNMTIDEVYQCGRRNGERVLAAQVIGSHEANKL